MGATYINTDLILEARFSLGPLAKAFRSAGLVQLGDITETDGVWRIAFETDGVDEPQDRCLTRLLTAAESLKGPHREAWDTCLTRHFDAGYVGNNDNFYESWKIESSILQRIAILNGDLVTTIYRESEE